VSHKGLPSPQASTATRSATRLRDTSTLKHHTLEKMIGQPQMAPHAAWVAAFEDRYLNLEKLPAVGVSPP
jgi:hypothetical protein